MSRPASEFAWRAADFAAAGQEIPERLAGEPLACEGQLMTDEEVETYIKDAIAAISILRDGQSQSLERVFLSFKADLDFLLLIGRIELDHYNELIDENSYGF